MKIEYKVEFSPYQQKGVVFFDSERMVIIAHDADDVHELMFIMNTQSAFDRNMLNELKIKR